MIDTRCRPDVVNALVAHFNHVFVNSSDVSVTEYIAATIALLKRQIVVIGQQSETLESRERNRATLRQEVADILLMLADTSKVN